MKSPILMIATLLCAGCASNYASVPIDEPHATITFQRNIEGVKADDNDPLQAYAVMDNPQCDNYQYTAGFSFNSQFIETARFSGDKKHHFHMHSVPNQNIYGPWCWSYLGFYVENGRDYVVMHESCSPVVYDTTGDEWQRINDVDVINGFECPAK